MNTSPEPNRGGRGPGIPEEVPSLALSVAGLDPCGGAGIIADMRTFDACGVYPMAVAATVTYQSTRGLEGRFDLPPEALRRQLEAVFSDVMPDAVKTGALGSAAAVDEIAAIMRNRRLGPLVVDPVVQSGGGEPLMDEGGVEVLTERLLPLAALVTPNTHEVSLLCGFEVFDVEDMKAAALRLVEMGVGAVLITGMKVGEGTGSEAADMFFNGSGFEVFTRPWIEDVNIHGTGCVLSAAITASLAKGDDMKSAVTAGLELVAVAMKNAVRPGTGAPCANPWEGQQCE